MSRLVLIVLMTAGGLACDEPPARGPNEWTYQNGYTQTSAQANGEQTTYANGYAQSTANPPPITYTPLAASSTQAQAQTAPTNIQTTPVPLGVQTLPPPTPSTSAGSATTPPTMAVPGPGAFGCSTDAQCLLGRCNTAYGRCAYPCKSSENDCKPGNVCSASGVCLPRAASGVSM